MANALITRKGGSLNLKKLAEVKFDNNIPTSQLYTTGTFNVQQNKKYMVVLTGQSQRGEITGTPEIIGGADTVYEVMSDNISLYSHTKVAVVKATSTQITVRGYSGFAMLFEF